jgi:hypothetical protein
VDDPALPGARSVDEPFAGEHGPGTLESHGSLGPGPATLFESSDMAMPERFPCTAGLKRRISPAARAAFAPMFRDRRSG